MAIVNCKECNKEVSASAKTCPHCGVSDPSVTMVAKIAAFALLVVIAGAGLAMCSSSEDSPPPAPEKPITQAPPEKWYEGGNLSGSGILEWQGASHKNKLATAADMVAGLHQKKMLNSVMSSKIQTVDDIKPFATELVACIDGASKKEPDSQKNEEMFANQDVADFAALCAVLMGWGK